MKQSLIELVNVIIERLQDNPHASPSEKGMRSWLARQGYNKRDIDAAMKMVRPRFGVLPNTEEQEPRSLRLFSIIEQHKLTSPAREALMRLEFYGLLDPYDRELILDHLHHFEGTVGLEELDQLLMWAVFGTRDVETQQTIYNVLEGREDILH